MAQYFHFLVIGGVIESFISIDNQKRVNVVLVDSFEKLREILLKFRAGSSSDMYDDSTYLAV